MEFKKKNEQNEKEFMIFRDGRVVPIHTEHGKTLPMDSFEDSKNPKEEMPPLQKKMESLNKNIFVKILKAILILAFTIFFMLSLKNVYTAFTSPPPSDSKQEQKQASDSSSHSILSNSINEISKDNPKSIKENTKQSVKQTEAVNGEISMWDFLDAVQSANQTVVKLSKEDINKINKFINSTASYISLKNTIVKNSDKKSELYEKFAIYKDRIKDENLMDLNEITEKRLFNSIMFSTEIENTLDYNRDKNSLEQIVQEYINDDEELRLQQMKIIEQILSKNHIPYVTNEDQSVIQYQR